MTPQEGYVDGRRVFSEGGGSWSRFFRGRSEDYEFWVTGSGVEMTLDGKHCWGLKFFLSVTDSLL